ncbi:hypothetical protein HY632_02325 [Candidatus Uhrbacteria bacterium]|nr:hypothetical protein [Candidatus Uhrbacteria bacterium]
MQQREPYPSFAHYLKEWLREGGRQPGDVGAALNIKPETVEGWLKGGRPSFNALADITKLCGYEFQQWNLEQYKAEIRAALQDPSWKGDRRVVAWIDLIGSWADLRALLEPIAKAIPYTLLSRFTGTHESTLRNFVLRTDSKKPDVINGVTFRRIVERLQQLDDIANGKVLHEISPLPILLEHLKNERLRRGLTKGKLASELGIANTDVITRWEESPDSVVAMYVESRHAIARFLGAKLLDVDEDAAAPKNSAAAPVDAAAEVPDGGAMASRGAQTTARASGDGAELMPLGTIPDSVQRPPEEVRIPAVRAAVPETSGLERRVAVLERGLLMLLTDLEARVDDAATPTLPEAPADQAGNGAPRNILSRETFRPFPAGTRWSEEDVQEGNRRIAAFCEFLLRHVELPETERVRCFARHAEGLAESNRLLRAWDAHNPSDLFPQFALERHIENWRSDTGASTPRRAAGPVGGRKS